MGSVEPPSLEKDLNSLCGLAPSPWMDVVTWSINPWKEDVPQSHPHALFIRHLLLGRKAMPTLDSVLKSRDITRLTKDSIVKAMVFPVVMYGYKSWTIKKTERQRINAFEL